MAKNMYAQVGRLICNYNFDICEFCLPHGHQAVAGQDNISRWIGLEKRIFFSRLMQKKSIYDLAS